MFDLYYILWYKVNMESELGRLLRNRHSIWKERRSPRKRKVGSRKDFIISLKLMRGGKCEMCGYDKNFAALVFHHVGHKEFTISNQGSTSVNSLKKTLDEVSRCKLLCANCHQDLHHPNYRR
jgi:hypothetical protein